MLTLNIEVGEFYNPSTEEFINIKPQEIRLEHSLVSISKWESKWEKPFLSSKDKTSEELLDYIRCMTVSQNVDPLIYSVALTKEHVDEVNAYINAKHSATFFSDETKKEGSAKRSSEIVTSELIYYWMIAANIPMECQKWHINRLLTLIKICSIKNEAPKKMSKGDIMRRNSSLNAARRRAMHTKG